MYCMLIVLKNNSGFLHWLVCFMRAQLLAWSLRCLVLSSGQSIQQVIRTSLESVWLCTDSAGRWS